VGLTRRCAEEHRQQGPVRLAHAREVQAGGSRPRSCSERGPPRGQARWCGASPWSVRPVATQGAALGSSKPGRGDAVATPSTRGRGDGGRRCPAAVRSSVAESCGSTVGRYRRLPLPPAGRHGASASRCSRTAVGSHGQRRRVRCGSLAGRAPGRPRCERRRSTGLGPAVVGGSVVRLRARDPSGCRARCDGGRGFARSVRSTLRGPSGPPARGGRSGCPRASVRFQRASVGWLQRRQRGSPRQAVTSRASGGNIASAPADLPIRVPRARVDSTVEGCG
jgi:hypothetical protein